LKPGKPPNELTLYWPIRLLPIVSKVCGKLLNWLLKMAENNGFIPNHQFGFRERHSTIGMKPFRSIHRHDSSI
jgi:hypothetical protein